MASGERLLGDMVVCVGREEVSGSATLGFRTFEPSRDFAAFETLQGAQVGAVAARCGPWSTRHALCSSFSCGVAAWKKSSWQALQKRG